jgi:hypothetical protein
MRRARRSGCPQGHAPGPLWRVGRSARRGPGLPSRFTRPCAGPLPPTHLVAPPPGTERAVPGTGLRRARCAGDPRPLRRRRHRPRLRPRCGAPAGPAGRRSAGAGRCRRVTLESRRVGIACACSGDGGLVPNKAHTRFPSPTQFPRVPTPATRRPPAPLRPRPRPRTPCSAALPVPRRRTSPPRAAPRRRTRELRGRASSLRRARRPPRMRRRRWSTQGLSF